MRITRTVYGLTALWMSLPFIAIGVYFALAGFQLIPLPGKANAPLWVIGMVGIIFAAAGTMLLAPALRSLWHRLRARRAAAAGAPPWLVDYPWQVGGIRDMLRSTALTGWVGGLFLLLFLLPFNWWAFISSDGNLFIRVITGAFDLMALLLLLISLYRTLRSLKYRRSQISFRHFPFTPGGRISVGFSPCSFQRLNVTLRFVEERLESSGSGNRRRSDYHSYLHWSETRQLQPAVQGDELVIEFDLPDRPEWQTRLTADPGIRYWELLIEAQQPGFDYRATFPLPVYAEAKGWQTSQPWPPLRNRRSGGFRFEIAMLLLLAAVLFGPLWIWPQAYPQWLQQTWQRAALLWQQPLRLTSVSAIQLQIDSQGQAWGLSKYDLIRFSPADDQPQQQLDRTTYRQRTGKPMAALSAFSVTDDEVLLGGWHGEVLRLRAGQLQPLGDGAKTIDGRIRALLPDGDGVLLVAARSGLWRWSGSGWQQEPGVEREPVYALQRQAGRVWAVTESALWRRDENGWRRLLKLAGGRSLRRAAEGWLIGTARGLLRWRDTGSPQVLFEGVQVRDALQQDGRIWMAAGKRGLYLLEGGVEQQIDPGFALYVTSLARQGDRLWLADYGAGFRVWPFSRWRGIAAGAPRRAAAAQR